MTATINAVWAARLMATLRANGVREVVLSPGSRSTPLALALHETPGLTPRLVLDERSAGFFALGMARATGAPVALVCTSGTAAANYFPAIVEASLTRVPLVVVTADRPPAARFSGAPQTIDQAKLYGAYVRRALEAPLPAASPAALGMWLAQVAQALALAQSAPAGPVHLNVPFAEPLAPPEAGTPEAEAAALAALPLLERRLPIPTAAPAGPGAPNPAALAELAAWFESLERPLVVAGPDAAGPALAEALARFSERAHVPILADVAAGVPGLATGDALARTWAPGKQPDGVLLLGHAPTAKGVLTWLEQARPEAARLGPDPAPGDPFGLTTRQVTGDPEAVLEALAGLPAPPPRAAWARAVAAADARVREARVALTLSPEAASARGALAALAPGDAVLVGNSMPLRHADSLAEVPSGVAVHALRGANGIDGLLSAGFGLAASGRYRRVLLLVGDVSALHDLGGLFAARYAGKTPVAVAVLDNDGGAIFSILPVANRVPAERFEACFGTPHGLRFEHAAAAFGLRYAEADRPEGFAAAVSEALDAPGVSLLRFASARAETAEKHLAAVRALAAAAASAWEEAPWPAR